MVEEDEEAQYDDITKYDEASSEDEQGEAITKEPKSERNDGASYVPGKPSEGTTFAMPAPNGYDSFRKAEQPPENKKETNGTEKLNESKED